MTAYVYDTQGNVTARGTQGFYFDQGNRLQSANGVASFAYDGWGRRIRVESSDGTYRTQVYSQAGQLLYGTKQLGMTSEATSYVYLGGKAIAELSSRTGTTYLHTDGLGSVVATVGEIPAALSYTCPSGWTLSGATCTQATTSTIAATVTGYSCPTGYTRSGSNCSKTTTTTSAATPNYSCASGWTLSGSTCSRTTSTAATPIYACPVGFTLSGSTCSGTGTTAATKTWDCKGYGSLQTLSWSPSGYYCATRTINSEAYDSCPDVAYSYGLAYVGFRQNGTNTVACYIGPVPVYSCPSGATLSGTTCTAPVTQAASISSYKCTSGTLSGSSCLTTSTAATSVSYSCAPGQALSGTTCTASSTSTVAGTPIYDCPSGYTLAGSSCTVQGTATVAATVNFSCASGTLSGGNCLGALSRARYEAYGKTAAGTVPTRIGFTGHVNDADTGLVYMQQRYYDPIAARFISVDQVTTNARTGDAFNRYEYALSNPYKHNDPDGRQAQLAIPLVQAVVRGAIGQAVRSTAPAAVGAAAGAAISNAVQSGSKGASITPSSAAAGAPEAAPATPGTQGCIYCVKGENTSSGKDYIGSTDNMGNRQRDKSDGRNREGADIVDSYPAGNRDERRTKEQKAINDRGGVENLDNKRNEVAPKNWGDKGIESPKPPVPKETE